MGSVAERFASKRGIRQGRVLLLGTVVLGATVLTVVFASAKPTTIYSLRVLEFVRQPILDAPVRIEGVLVDGSLCKVADKCEYRFRLTDSPGAATLVSRAELAVRYAGCAVPDTFRDISGFDLSVTVAGELCEDCSYFAASNIMAKCPSKYEVPNAAVLARARPVPQCPP
jgi:cytochrome c-type biogenesis protein CcmE